MRLRPCPPFRRFIVIALALLCAGPGARGAPATAADPGDGATVSVPFDTLRWRFSGNPPRFETHLGRPSVFLPGGAATLRGLDLADGTIEVDVAVSGTRGFFGVVFHHRSDDEHEQFYLRPHKSELPDATQYTPVFHGNAAWQLYSGPGFTAAVPIPRDRWIPLRIELRGRAARIFAGDSAVAPLLVADLKHPAASGSAGITASRLGAAHFSNFRYTPAPAAPSDARAAGGPAMRPGVLERWELSGAFDPPASGPDTLPSAAAMRGMTWDTVNAEAPGLLVIDRHRAAPGLLPPFAGEGASPRSRPRAVIARTTIRSGDGVARRLAFGYSDEVTIFLNGRPVFEGRSAYRFRDPLFLGIMGEYDAVYLPLRRGDNELAFVVREYFGGWGLMARLADDTGGGAQVP